MEGEREREEGERGIASPIRLLLVVGRRLAVDCLEEDRKWREREILQELQGDTEREIT